MALQDEQPLSAEAERLRLERKKAFLDAWLRRQDLALRRRESELKFRELQIKEAEHNRNRWQNPTTVAIAVAALGLLGNAIAIMLNGQATRRVEAQKAQDSRVLEMIKVGDQAQARKNLNMLVESGLFDDANGKLRKYLDSVPIGEGPVLTAPGSSDIRSCEPGNVPKELVDEVKNSLDPDALKWMPFALAEIGVSECSPRSDRIVEYLKTIPSLSASNSLSKAIPWSSAFINWVFRQANIQGSNSAANASWLQWGVAIESPKPGAVVVMKRGTSGHNAGFFLKKVDENSILTLAGNTRDQVTTATFPVGAVVGYRWPKF